MHQLYYLKILTMIRKTQNDNNNVKDKYVNGYVVIFLVFLFFINY